MESRKCKKININCIKNTSQNRFNSYESCMSKCLPDINPNESEGIFLF